MQITKFEILIKVTRDEETGIYVAEGVNLPGLILEAETPGDLRNLVTEMVPDVISENGLPRDAVSFPIWQLPFRNPIAATHILPLAFKVWRESQKHDAEVWRVPFSQDMLGA